MLARGQFRCDLYYRLNVFPILLPALRERREDIPALVTHFVKLFSRRMGKQVDSIPSETVAAFQSYSWPGNIRELQNLVERAVILSRDGVLRNPLHKNQTELMIPRLHRTRTYYSSKTLEDSDRALILETLEQAGWIVGGPHGACDETGTETNHAACEDDKAGYLPADPSGRNRRVRHGTGRCSDLKADCSICKIEHLCYAFSVEHAERGKQAGGGRANATALSARCRRSGASTGLDQRCTSPPK
jgi:hypothetical protein